MRYHSQAYYQPSPAAPAPFSINSAYNDPSLNGMTQGWGLVVQNSYDILIFGAGLYSFFEVRSMLIYFPHHEYKSDLIS